MAVTSPSNTVVLRCRCRIERIGQATSDGGKPGRRDLVEQRLKQVIVVPVDDRDVGVDARERLRGKQAAEAGADDDDARTSHALLPAAEIAVRVMR